MIYSTRHPKNKSSFWKFADDGRTMEKLMSIGVSANFMIVDLLDWNKDEIELMFDELRKDMPEE